MNSYVEIYLHFVWGTWNREPLIDPEWERDLWREIQNEVIKQDCRLLALGGTHDHVHSLVQFHSTLTVAKFVQQTKGASSLFVNQSIRPESQFKWQGAYGVFSVGHNEVLGITGYIKNQKLHHIQNTLIERYERTNVPDVLAS